MIFRTEIEKITYPFKVSYADTILMLGSCFVENIGRILEESAFDVLVNPCGIIFNPKSIITTFHHILQDTQYTRQDLDFAQEMWFSFDHHGSFSSTNPDEVLVKMQKQTDQAHAQLRHASLIFITFGTSWAYRYKERGNIVANCHKLPASCFEKEFITAQTIIQDFNEIILRLCQFNPHLNFIFSVSPVRHVSDGLIENQKSKANLIGSVHQICAQNSNCFYFPSYEMINDDLRDYRFYGADLCHVNDLGINYIWDYFKMVFFEEETMTLQKEMQQLYKDFQHKPLHPDTQAYQKFKAALAQRQQILTDTILKIKKR